MDYELFITQGKQLGYSGEELQEFVTECVQFERESASKIEKNVILKEKNVRLNES